MTDQTAYRPRRSPAAGAPRIDEADLPDPDELARLRRQVAGVRRVRGRSHPDRPVCL